MTSLVEAILKLAATAAGLLVSGILIARARSAARDLVDPWGPAGPASAPESMINTRAPQLGPPN